MDRGFSIIIATYTGTETISVTFESLLKQSDPKIPYEIIVIIDGPNDGLKRQVYDARDKFVLKGIDFRIKQHKQNYGRFDSRLDGAEIAKYPYLLIVDDRVELPEDYLKSMIELGKEAAMPNVEESGHKNIVSLAMVSIRSKLYGAQRRHEVNFYIDEKNFDKSAKGTTSLWIKRQVFVQACNKLAKTLTITKNSSDDTRLLRYVVESGAKIYKSGNIKIKYHSRNSAKAELKHILYRGPKFIDYYLSPGRRYFLPLLLFFPAVVVGIIIITLKPILLLLFLGLSAIIALWLANWSINFLPIWLGLMGTVISFSIGLFWGLFEKFRAKC